MEMVKCSEKLMGWVKERVADITAYRKLTPEFWNSVRDAIGLAGNEFNNHGGIMPDDRLTSSDCQSKARHCVRVTRGERTVELFINETERSIHLFLLPEQKTTAIATLGLDQDRKRIKIMTSDADGSLKEITSDQLCELALSDLLFNPLPMMYPVVS
jgi:hypothetical protein